MAKRKIVDAHHHLWDLDRGRNYAWLQDRPLPVGVCGDVGPIARNYLLDDYLADTADFELVQSVHIEAVSTDPLGETRWLQDLADRRGRPFGIVARVELHRPGVEREIAGHRLARNLRGVRHIVNWHRNPRWTFVDRDDFLVDSAWLAGFKLLRKYDLSFDLQLYPSQMADAARLARSNPDTLIVLNHTGMPVDRDTAGLEAWRNGMRLLAGAENVVAKISGLGMVDWHWTQSSIRPFVLETIDVFGTDRVMFASNFPVDRLYGGFSALYGAFAALVAAFSDDEQDRMFRANALKYYRL